MDHLLAGVKSLGAAALRDLTTSSVYQTPPVGYAHQPDFLNMVVAGSTDLPPDQLLAIFQAVEGEAGRTRELRNGPRTLDVDLLFFGSRILRTHGLRVPHPRWKERAFVVRPLAEIAPDLRDPETGWQVHEVSNRWPMDPREIRVVLESRGFEKALEEWEL